MILILHTWEVVQRSLIEAVEDGEVTVVRSLPVAVKAVQTGRFDIAVVDADATLDNVRALAQYVKVIALTVDKTGKVEDRALKAGAAGVIWLGLSLGEISVALEKYRKEGPHEYQPLRWNQVISLDGTPLGETQLKVLELTTMGNTSAQVAKKLKLSEGYVNQVMRDLYGKFDLVDKPAGSKRVLLAVRAVQMGVVS